MKPLISCNHADFGYEHQDAVTDVCLEIFPGDYICVLGANGSGKSTLLKGILGLLKPLAGSVQMGQQLTSTGIGYLPQQTAAQRDFPATVWEVVLSGCLGQMGWKPFYTSSHKQLAAHQMEKLNITHLKKSCYRELSGGQQQRVLIARALCATNRLLVLDEPVTGLDPAAAQEFYQTLKALNQKEQIAVLMVTHDLGHALSQSDQILHLDQRVLFYGTTEAYKKSEVGRRFLGGEADGTD